VLAAVGDEQSLARSLSTFSAHLVTLSGILQTARERVLVLLDELAGATDPEAGAALACAVISRLIEAGASVAVTTHYEALKALAAEREDMRNASVGFDFEEMAPTFQLRMGVPGGSNALEIARRYGIDAEVVEEARRALSDHSRSFERLVASLEAATRAAREEHAELERDRRALGQARAELEARRKELEQRDARGLGREASRLVDQVREVQRRLDAVRKALRVEASAEAVELGRETARDATELLTDIDAHRHSLQPEPIETGELDPAKLAVGDRVWVQRLRSVADVVETSSRGKARVSAGMMKLWVDVSDLRSVKEAPRSSPDGTSRPVSGQRPAVKPTIRTRDNTLDVRGMRVNEAVPMTEAFLDRMYGAAEPKAFILHGVGSGALRDAIHEHLAREGTYVDEFHQATQDEGGPQVTVVSLK
jgi:DNA mismatch repair protein MutS2